MIVTVGVRDYLNRSRIFSMPDVNSRSTRGLLLGASPILAPTRPVRAMSHLAANLGQARGYAVDYRTGNAVYDNRFGLFVGGGLPPSPVAGIVDVDGTKHPFCIGCYQEGSTSFLQVNPINIDPKGSRYRSYWYIEND